MSRFVPSRLLLALTLLPIAGFGQSETVFEATLLGSNEVPPVPSLASGSCTAVLNGAANQLDLGCTYTGLTPEAPPGVQGSVHIHNAPPGQNGGIVFDLSPALTPVGFGAADGSIQFDGSIQATLPLTPAQAAELQAGVYYVNIHTAAYPGGEIRGQLSPVQPSEPVAFTVALGGGREVPPVQSNAIGKCQGLLNANRTLFTLDCQHNLLTAEPGGHIHIGELGVNGDIVFNLPGLGGSPVRASWDVTPELAIGRPAINRPLSPDMVAHLLAGRLYVNLHSAQHPAGELRGQIYRFEPGVEGIPTLSGLAMVLVAGCCGGLGLLVLRRRRAM